MVAGIILLGWSVVAAVLVHFDPAPNKLDAWGFSAFPSEYHDAFLLRVTELRTLPILVIGSALAALTVVGRDRWRVIACLVGPVAAVVIVEWLMKPLIGRRLGMVLDYPSGSVTVVAGMATAWALAVPRTIRWAVIVVGSAVVAMVMVAVVRLGWHYPTDALAGAIVGVGVVLSLDGTLQFLRTERADLMTSGHRDRSGSHQN